MFYKKTNERIAVFIRRRRISAPPAFAGIAIIAALIVVGRFTRMVKMKLTRGSQQIFTVWRVVLLLKGLRHGKQESLLCIIKNVRMAGVLWTAILMLFYAPQQFTG